MQNKGEFLNHLQERTRLPDRECTERVAEAVLRNLHERLGPEADDLKAQLPEDLKPMLEGGMLQKARDAITPQQKLSFDELVEKVADDGGVSRADAEQATRAVFHELKEHITDGQSRHVEAVLPTDIQQVWQSA